MSIRSSRPRLGDTASQLWASPQEVRELIDLLDPRSQTELAALVPSFLGQDGQSDKEKLLAMISKNVEGKSDAELKSMMSRMTQSENFPQNGIDFEGASK